MMENTTFITASDFLDFIKGFRDYLVLYESISTVSDAEVLNFIHGFDTFEHPNNDLSRVNFIFSKKETSIEVIANQLYMALLETYKAYQDNERTVENILNSWLLEASFIKTLLKLIKYTCTEFEEAGNDTSIFSNQSLFNLIKNDNNLSPVNFKFISRKDFLEKQMLSNDSDTNGINPLCVNTNYRIVNFDKVFDFSANIPLIVLRANRFYYSTDSFLDNYIAKYTSFFNIKKYYVSGFYAGNSLYFEKPCDDKLITLHSDLMALLSEKEFKDVEINYAMIFRHTLIGKCSFDIKIFIFTKNEKNEFILNSFLVSNSMKNSGPTVFLTKLIPFEIVEKILNVFIEYYDNKIHDTSEEAPEKNFANFEIVSKNFHELKEKLYKKRYELNVPNVIIRP